MQDECTTAPHGQIGANPGAEPSAGRMCPGTEGAREKGRRGGAGREEEGGGRKRSGMSSIINRTSHKG